jgi:tape measure domain-containing protein
MPVVGRAQILVGPSFAGFQTAVRKQMPGLGQTGGKMFAGGFSRTGAAGVGGLIAGKAATGLKRSAQVTGGAVGGIMALAIAKGFQRLTAIETAQAKLRGLGHDAETITEIMTSALASVKGTAFGMGDAATAAASAVAAGIKPGQELTKYLKLTADAATIAGTSFSDMSRIINQVTTAGRAQTEDLNMLAERGIPIYQWLADEYGVTALELRKMVTEGKVDSATFRRAIEENIGGAALQSGATTQGAFKNMQAAIGRVGANLLTGVFPLFRQGFQAVTDGLSPIEDKAASAGRAIGDWAGRTIAGLKGVYALLVKGDYTGELYRALGAGWTEDGRIVDWLFDLREGFVRVKGTVADFWRSTVAREGDQFRESLQSLRDSAVVLWPTIRDLAGELIALRTLLPSLSSVISGANTGLRLFADGIAFVAEHQEAAMRVGTVLLALYAAHRTALAIQRGILLAHAAAQAVSNAAMAIAVFQYRAISVAMKAWRVAQLLATGAQWALNAAMTANPIGLIVAGLVALGVAVVIAYRKSETFRAIVQGAWAGIQTAAAAAWNFLSGVVWPGLQMVFSALGRAALWLWNNAIKPAWEGLAAGFRAVGNVVSSVWRGFLSPVFQLIGAIVVWLAVKVFKVHLAGIRAGWQLLGAGIQLVYRRIIKPAVEAFAAAGRWLWNNVLKPAWAAVRAGWQLLGQLVRARYARDIKPILDAFGSFAKWVWERVISPAWRALRSAWSTVSTAIRAGYRDHIKPILEAVGTTVGKLKGVFEKAVTAIGKAWDGLRAAARKPVKFVIDVINGLIGKEDGSGGGFNKLAKKFGTDRISQIGYPKGLGFARGGIEPGRSSWRDGDTLVRGFRPGEGVTVSEALKDPVERERLIALNKAAIRGESAAAFRRKWHGDLKEPPGYWLGGILPVSGPTNRHTSGYPWARWAGDIPAGHGRRVGAWKKGRVASTNRWNYSYGHHVRLNHDGAQTLYAHLSRIAVRAGQKVRGGQTIGAVGNTGNSKGPHLHFEVKGGNVDGGDTSKGTGGIIERLINWGKRMKDTLSGPLKKLKELSGNPMGQLAGAVPRKIAGMMYDKAKTWVTKIISGGGDGGKAVGRGRAAARAAGLRLGASSVSTYPGHQPSMNKAWDFMARGRTGQTIANHLAKNRNQYGISYLIWNREILRDYRKGSIPAGRWSRYFDGGSSNPNRAHTNHVHASFYARGTANARRGLAVVGERQPELVNFRGGEQVAANRNQAVDMFGSSGPQEIRGKLDLGNGLVGMLTGIVGDVVDQRDVRSSRRANLPR